MTIDDCTLHDVHTSRGSENLHRAGFASCTPPDSQNAAMAENSEKGVSTRNTLFATPQSQQSPSEAAHWYALRTTYGRESARRMTIWSRRGLPHSFPPSRWKKRSTANGRWSPNHDCRTYSLHAALRARSRLSSTTTSICHTYDFTIGTPLWDEQQKRLP